MKVRVQKAVLFGAILIVYAIVFALTVPQKSPELKPIPEPETVRVRLKSIAPTVEQSAVVPPSVIVEKKRADPTKPVEVTPDIEPKEPAQVSAPAVVPTVNSVQEPVKGSSTVVETPVYQPTASEIESARSKWFSAVRSTVESRKKYPKQAMLAEIEGTVTIRLKILKNGTVSSCEIPSGKNGVLERATLAAMADLRSVAPIPEIVQKSEMTVDIPLVYELK